MQVSAHARRLCCVRVFGVEGVRQRRLLPRTPLARDVLAPRNQPLLLDTHAHPTTPQPGLSAWPSTTSCCASRRS
jgi:hypothetical protein